MQPKNTALDEVIALIIKGEDKKAKSLIESSCLLDATDNHGRTLLHFTANHNMPRMLRYLLDEGCNPNPIDAMGNSPLTMAMERYKEKVLTMLLDAGADIERLDRTGQSPLRMALNRDGYITDSQLQRILESLRKKYGGSSEETAKRLMDAGCRLDQAAFLRDARIIDYMLKQGVAARRVGERTALHVAASLDDVKTVKLLIEHDVDLCRARGRYGFMPLSYVYNRNEEHNNEKIEMLECFLKAGASPTDCSKQGNFQVDATLMRGSAKAIRVLMQSEIDCTVRDEATGGTVLHYLAANTNEGVAKVLKPHVGQFDVNAPDRIGSSPLHRAASEGSAEMVKFLLEHGAEVDRVREGVHSTPLFVVYWDWDPEFGKRYGKCVNLLLQHGADPQFVDGQGHEQTTIFTIAEGRKRVKPVYARLALMERLGVKIRDATRDEINAFRSLTKYWEKCKLMLDQRLYSEFTIYDLLTANRKRMIRYVNVIESIYNLKGMQNISSYYYEIIKRRFLKYSKYVKSQATVRAVLCELLQNRVDSSNIIIEQIEDYLDDKSLDNLYELGQNGDFSK